jgi:AAA family ATP:ADP antiporter
LLACIFLILTSYYLMKTAREGLILSGHTFGLRGEELKSYAGGAMAVLLIGLIPAYGALADRVGRIRLINVSYVVVIGSLLGFYGVAVTNLAPIGLAFFVWVGIINMFLIAQFWSYANDLYSEEQGKRLFAIIAIGGSLGGLVGPQLAKLVTTYTLLPFAAVLLVGCIALFNLVDHVNVREAPASLAEEPIDGVGGFALVARNRYLLLIAALVLVAELVKTNGEFVLSSTATEYAAQAIPATAHAGLSEAARAAAIAADRREVIKAFYGDFFMWVNLSSFVLQAFLVSRLIDKAGVRRALFVMPILALGAYGAIVLIGGAALVRVAKIGENSTEYSVQNTVRQTLYLPTDRAMKYKAKAAIDTFVVRVADLLSAVFVWFGVHHLGAGARGVALANLGLVVVWIAIVVGVARCNRQLSAAEPHNPA